MGIFGKIDYWFNGGAKSRHQIDAESFSSKATRMLGHKAEALALIDYMETELFRHKADILEAQARLAADREGYNPPVRIAITQDAELDKEFQNVLEAQGGRP